MKVRRVRVFASLIVGASLIATACAGDDDEQAADPAATAGVGTSDNGSTGPTGGTPAGSPTSAEPVAEGGTLVLGAEQEPDCTDWIATCAGSSWGYWTMTVQTMPRTFDIVPDGESWVYAPNSMLDGEPKLEASPEQVVTYSISDQAVWNDGEPISCSDFVYTWQQIANGKDIYDTTGYVEIASVDCPDDKTAVVTYKKPFAGWRSLFGGQYGLYPSHLLEGKDRFALMKDGYDFSGGPWIIEKWEKGVEISLVPNENFWGDMPKVDRAVFRIIPDTAAQFQAFKAGEVSAIYPQPQLDTVEQINAGLPGVNSSISANTASLEGLWIHNGKAPFDSKVVRQALAYSLDRDAIVERLFGALDVTEATQSFNPPIFAGFGDPDSFSGYTRDLDKVDELMEGDGWSKDDDGIWAKGGQRASAVFKTTAGNKRRELTQQIVQEQAKEAGFELKIDNQAANDLFGSQLPQGDFQLALYAQNSTSLEPFNCSLFCSTNISSEENGFSGQNFTRTDIEGLDPLLQEVDSNLDESARAAAQKEADALIAEEATSIPLDPLPNIVLWSDAIAGPVGDHPILGPFHNMNLWGLAD